MDVTQISPLFPKEISRTHAREATAAPAVARIAYLFHDVLRGDGKVRNGAQRAKQRPRGEGLRFGYTRQRATIAILVTYRVIIWPFCVIKNLLLT